MEEGKKNGGKTDLNLKSYIKARGYRIKDFAKYLNTSERNLRRILNFQQPLSPSKALILLKRGIPLTVIFPHLDDDLRNLLKFLLGRNGERVKF